MKDRYIVLFVILLALASRFAVYPFTLVGGDDGRYIQDAMRVWQGEIPIADFTTRTPLLLWLMAASRELFGLSLLTFRMPVLIASALTAAFIYLLGKELFSRRIGLIAGCLYAILPIAIWNNAIIKSETLMTLCIVAGAFFIAKGLRTGKLYFFLGAGIVSGLAYIERHSAVAFIVAAAAIIIFHAWKQYAGDVRAVSFAVLKRGSSMLSGFLLGFLSVFSIIAWKNSAAAFKFWFTPFLADASLSVKEEAISSSLYTFLRAWGLTFIEDLAVQSGILFVGLVVFFIIVIRSIWCDNTYFRQLATGGIALLGMGALVIHATKIVSVGTFRPYVFLALEIISLGLFFLLMKIYRHDQSVEESYARESWPYWFILFWIGSHVLIYSLFFIPGYEREITPTITIATALVLGSFSWKRIGRVTRWGIVCLATALWMVGAAWFWDPITGGWWWRQDTIQEAAAYLQEHTSPGEEVLAANPLPVILADRTVVQNLNSYSMRFAQHEHDRWGTFPSPREMYQILDTSPPRYVVVDGRFENHFLKTYPFFNDFLYTRYEKAAEFGTGYRRDWIQIWKLQHLYGA